MADLVAAPDFVALGDLSLFPMAFGTMNLAGEGRPSKEVALQTLRAACDAGVDLIDTADVYGRDGDDAHHAETLVAALRQTHPSVKVATKGGVRRHGDVWEHRGDPAYLRSACVASLRALQRDVVDLYFLHAVDARVPIAESVGALGRLRDEGKIARIGVSNVSAPELRAALREAPLLAVQNEGSPFVRMDPDVEAICRAEGLVLQAYAPMGGWRAGRVAHEPTLRRIATELGLSPFEAIVAWTRSRGWMPVCGGSRPENARSSAEAARRTLSDVQREAIDALAG